MTEKELKRLGRAELIDILYEQQKQLEASEEKIALLRARLDEKELRISEAGSIAEAALRINGVFEAAQSAAEQYLVSVRAASEKADEIISAAKAQADEIIRQAKEKPQQDIDGETDL